MLNKKTGILTLASLLILNGCSYFIKNKITPYVFNSAIIEIAQIGNVEGKTTLYIKGDKSLSETHAIKKEDEKIDTLYLNLGEKIYQIDLNSKTGYSGQNPFYEELKKQNPEKRMEFLKKSILGLNSGENLPTPIGQKQIDGKSCDLYRIQEITDLCIWNGVTIYEKTVFPELGIDSTSTATKIETNVDISDDKFKIPAGITIK